MTKEEQLNIVYQCVEACMNCSYQCLLEDDVKKMVECIRLDRECAAICKYTADAIIVDAPHKSDVLALCRKICLACAEECSKHDNDHCQKCAEACRRCADACAN